MERIAPTLEAFHLSKKFLGVQALNDVSVRFEPGTVHALMGENGAGKSTLGKILAGVYHPDSGEIHLDGKPVAINNPHQAQKLGIGIVHQELLFCENLSVAENLCLGNVPHIGPVVNFRKMREQAKAALELIGSQINPDILVSALPIAQQQLVQIAGALATGAKILIFDEPTSSLGPNETARLLGIIRDLKQAGVTSIFVSHRLDEIFAVCDSVTVLRDGKFVGSHPIRELDKNRLVAMMIGRELDANSRVPKSVAPSDQAILSLSSFSSPGKFSDINLTVKKGEIVGIGGLVGSGRTELLEGIFGLDAKASGIRVVDGKELPTSFPPTKAPDYGLGLVPEDRKRHGLVIPMSIRSNMSLPFIFKLKRFLAINRKKESEVVQVYFNEMRIKAPQAGTIVGSLSGGNQQKVVLAKWLAAGGHVLLVDEPTRGVDVGAKAEIHRLLRQVADEGRGVLVVSSEMPELLAISDRILVMRQGRLVGEVSPEQATEESLMKLMAGVEAGAA